MILKELAGILDGREMGEETNDRDEKYAKDNGAVIVFGASDDLMELRGALNDECDCYEGRMIYLNLIGEIECECDSMDCPYFAAIKDEASGIEARWDSEGYSWTYETNIPHETFEIMENGEKYCRGIVFLLADVNE